MVRIPVEYQEVEYLESTGDQYIDTGVVPSITDVYSWSGEFRHIQNAVLFGCRTSGTYANDNHLYLNRSSNIGIYGIFLISNAAGQGVEKRNIVLAWDCPDIYTTEASKLSIEGYTTENFKPAQSIYLLGFNVLGTNNSSVGGGKLKFFKIDGRCNLIPCYRKSDSEPGMYDTVTKQFFTNQGTGTFLVGNDISWDTASLIERRRQILLNTPHLTTESANPLTFQTDISANLKDCKIYFEPVQEGTGDPSPDNVRPISGWDGVTVYKKGANLFPLTLPSTAFKGIFGTGSSTIGSATNGRVWTMYVGENQKLYYQHIVGDSPGVLFAFSDVPLTTRTGAVIYNALNCSSRNDVTLNSTTHPYLVIAITTVNVLTPETGPLDAASAMLSFGNTRKSYEKRNDPLSITIPFPKTIYGWYVDLVRGEVVEELSQIASYNGETLPGEWISDRDVYTAGTSPTIGAQVAYKLATPITHQLTPQTIKTLKGTNNIWSDANGNIEVKFWKH